MNTDEHRSEIILFILYLLCHIRVYLWFMLFSKEGISPDEPAPASTVSAFFGPGSLYALCSSLSQYKMMIDEPEEG